MKIIKPSFEIMTPIDREQILCDIEIIGRTCYKSEDKITKDSASKFVKMLIERGHEAIIEHVNITVKIICDRGVSHEIVRHRLASYAQESTRYCNYSKDKFDNELTFIKPCFWNPSSFDSLVTWQYDTWYEIMQLIENQYMSLLETGVTPQEARSILPNSLKTEIIITMNLREWRHFFKLRCAKVAHPQMREITIPMLKEFQRLLPEVFGDCEIE